MALRSARSLDEKIGEADSSSAAKAKGRATSRPKTIFRNASSRKPYTSILNRTLQDPELSPEAGWVLVLVLSLPPDWEVHLEWVAEHRRMGRDRVRAAVRELEKRKYCKRQRTRKKDGTLGGSEFAFTDEPGVFDQPATEDQSQAVQQNQEPPAPEKPGPGFPPPTKETSPTKETVSHKKAGLAPKVVEQVELDGDGLTPVSVTDALEASEANAEQEATRAPGTRPAKAPEPMWRGKPLFISGGGDGLIPFDSVLPAAMAEATAEEAAKAVTGIRTGYIPGNEAAFRVECHRLCVDPVPIVKRYLAEAERRRRQGLERIRQPTAYLIRAARAEAAERDGMTVGQVAAASKVQKAHQAGRKAAIDAGDLDEAALRAKCAAARPKSGAALAAALNGGRA